MLGRVTTDINRHAYYAQGCPVSIRTVKFLIPIEQVTSRLANQQQTDHLLRAVTMHANQLCTLIVNVALQLFNTTAEKCNQ